MRCFPAILVAVLLASASARAQTPTDLQPLPVVPPPPPDMAPLDASLEPQVTITKRDGNTVEEHRVNGKLYKIKVTPEHGVPYYLVDREGDGNFSQETMGSPEVSVPTWVIGTF
ncbi:MAG TPA: DUF2782 domain-containing protein [Accumulibacter sp.]|nr:DUF2782 domain-containing protein [Accumulibacter sp.]